MASISSPLSFLSSFNIVSSKQSKPNHRRVSKVITMASHNGNQPNPLIETGKEEKASSLALGNRRRDVLIGLGALYGAATITGVAEATDHQSEASRSSVKFPITLDSSVSVVVKRPKKSRSKKEKEEEEEVLVVDGIEFDRNEAVKFDVILNCEDDIINQIGPKNREFAGSFVSLPHGNKRGNKRMNTCFRLGLTDLLQDLEGDEDDSVLVTLVPKIGTGLVKVNGMKIELVAAE